MQRFFSITGGGVGFAHQSQNSVYAANRVSQAQNANLWKENPICCIRCTPRCTCDATLP